MAARQQVTRSVTVAAPPERVWQVLCEPGGLDRWLGTAGHRPRLLHVEAGNDARLELWWCHQVGDVADVSVVRLEVSAEGEGSRVTVTETAIADHPDALPPALQVPGGVPVGAGAPA